jgi:uncharacterized iron-regulated membrane protein
MASDGQSTKQRLRKLWFQVHKWIGLTLAVLIIPISLTGSALVWHDWLDATLNPEREVSSQPTQPAAFYAEAARRSLAPGETLVSLTFPEEPGPVLATAARDTPPPAGGRPVRTQLYLDPADGRVLDRSASDQGAVRVLHMLHGSLMVPGVGRQIVGWIGVAMLLSSLTGLWLWWPFKGGFKRGLQWQRTTTTSGNLHHLGGFWIALPLAVLSLTGAWISFPAFFGSLSGERGGPPPGFMRQKVAKPIGQTRLSPDQALAAAQPTATGTTRSIGWPTTVDGQWTISFARQGGPAEVKVADSSAAVTGPEPLRPETTARLMRRIHDGTEMGLLWQIVIFLGGLIPAVLAVTGIMMWLNLRRKKTAARRRRELDPVPA